MRIHSDQLVSFVTHIFESAGASQDHAREVAEHLVDANLKGHDSHGVGMIPAYAHSLMQGFLDPQAEAKILKDHGAVILVDGETGFGQVVGRQATEIALARVKETGIVCLGLRNAHHLGRIGAYGELCGYAGYGSIHFVNVVGHEPLVAPFGGRERRITTNPFCCVVPRLGKEPIVLDMATSAVAMGKIRVASMKGVEVDPGTLVDHQGMSTTDPNVMFEEPFGALSPFGKHKGYGLGLMCELLGGALVGEWTAQPEQPRPGTIINHMLMFVFDPDIFDGVSKFQSEVESMVDYIHSTTPAKGIDRVRVPGEPEREAQAERSSNGIEIDPNSWSGICQVAESVGVNVDGFT